MAEAAPEANVDRPQAKAAEMAIRTGVFMPIILSARLPRNASAPANARNALRFRARLRPEKRDGGKLSPLVSVSSPGRALDHLRLRPSDFSNAMMRVVVRRTVSGLRLIESMPRRTRNSAISG